MKRTSTRALSFVIVLAIVVSLFAGMLTTSAASYTANWGKRGQVATSPSSKASSYYTGSYSYATLSSLSGSTSSSAASIYASPLGTALHKLSSDRQSYTTSYDSTKSLYMYTDCENGNTSTISSFYSGKNMNSAWGSGWNREHTWPNSKGLNGSDENDIMMLRPTAESENNSRGNTAYGESSGYYDPNSEANGKYNLHGDIARLMLQHMIRWGNTRYMFGSGGVMESRAVLLKWIEEDPVDTWELGRNDAVQSITGVRNVFVDYPELAFLLLGESVPAGYSTPSNSNGATQPTTPTQPVTGNEYVLTDSLKNGDKAVIYNPGNGEAVPAISTGNYYLSVVAVTPTGNKITTTDDSIIWDVVKNSDGTYTFKNGANTLSLNWNTSNSKTSVSLDGTNPKLTVESLNAETSSYVIYSATQTGNHDHIYLERYEYNGAGEFTAYDTSADRVTEASFGFQFYVLNEGGSEPTEPTEPTNPTTPTDPTEPTEPTTPTESTTACNHTYVDTKVGATCAQPGYTLHTCSKCGYSYRSAFTETLSHSFSGGICVNCGAEDPNYVDPTPDIPYDDSPLYASYKDLEKEAWYRSGIVYALHQGLMNGVGKENEHIFDPSGKVTRAMVVTILYRAAGSPSAKGLALPFEDVETGSWYTSAVAWAADQGIVLGVSDTEFDPHSPITREQLAAILYRYAGEPAAQGNLSAYIDAKNVTEYAISALKWAIGEKIITGIDNRLAPQETATRAQIATVFFRYLDPVAAKEAQERLENDPNPYD